MSTDVVAPPSVSRSTSAHDPVPLSDAALRYKPPVYRQVITAIVAIAPILTAGYLVIHAIDGTIAWRQALLMVVFLVVIGHGITIGYHRLFTHRSFEARRPLKIALAILGSLSLQGSLIGWVADHRRHHRYSDRTGDPHSPLWKNQTPLQEWGGLWHAHVGWCFTSEPTSRVDYVPDLLADRDLVMIDRLFVPFTLATLLIPFAIGYALEGTLAGAVAGLLWAGVLRIGISHNVTWSVNSVCHRFGKRPFRTRDQSTNFAPLAIFTMGESFHNNHHAFPRSARHGMGRRQLDSSAALIRVFERLGWARNVQWPERIDLEHRRAAA